MVDLMIYETGSGGDLLMRGGDLVITTGKENEPYISMFGGADYWGNFLAAQGTQFLATTEQVLREVPLNSAGRIRISAAVDKDLQVLKDSEPGTTITNTVTITGNNSLSIEINIAGQAFYYVWNPDTLFLTYQIR
jgi:hypothetical protein